MRSPINMYGSIAKKSASAMRSPINMYGDEERVVVPVVVYLLRESIKGSEKEVKSTDESRKLLLL